MGTYDTPESKEIGLSAIVDLMMDAGATKIFIKKLSPNDNSKNQPYFGHQITDLPFIPTGKMVASESASNKTKDPSRKIKYLASIRLEWITTTGEKYPAPDAQLIFYPQYPEVRFSGFLRGSKVNLSRWMSPDKQGRAENRWLLLGVAENKTVYGYLASPESALSKELENTQLTRITQLFFEIDVRHRYGVRDTRSALLEKLLEIHQMGWVSGQKLGSNMIAQPYKAPNGGGYTLESLLEISPNGISEPDYLGWEVKQFGVTSFPRKNAKPTTLMTPEPNGGTYTVQGAAAFVRRFGYPDKSGIPDRWNIGGIHIANKLCTATKLTLRVDGFNVKEHKITKAAGAITLVDQVDTVAASWGFEKLMDHWKRKHSQAVYIPCMIRTGKTGGSEYCYGSNVELGTDTNFEMFLSAMLNGYIYYDPGIKLENASQPKPLLKRRSQFRVKHKHLNELYKVLDFVDLTSGVTQS